MKNSKHILIVLVFLILCLTGCQNSSGSGPVAVIVNGENISQKQLDLQYRLLKYEYEQQQGVTLDETRDQVMITKLTDSAFENLIVQTLIRQEAQKRNLAVSSMEIDKALEQFKSTQNASNKSNGYQEFLTKLNMNEAEVKTQIETLMLTSQLQEKVVTFEPVTDEQAQKYYQDNPELFVDEGGLQIYHILVDNENLANQLLDRLNRGEDFGALAQQYSIDPGSKEQGGDVGLVSNKTNFVPEFKQPALSLKPGQTYSKPVKSAFGFHIIKAGDKQAPKKLLFNEVKEQIKQQLGYEQKDKGFSDYVQNLRDNAEIQDKRQR